MLLNIMIYFEIFYYNFVPYNFSRRWNTTNLRFLSQIPRDYLSAGPVFFVSKSLLSANSFLANLAFDFSHWQYFNHKNNQFGLD